MKSEAEVLSTRTPELFRSAVEKAAELLRAGAVVALPTETVYGLAANALDPKAVARVFEIKGRPALNPVIVHVASLEMARRCVAGWPEVAVKLATAFWPGPLTLVLTRSGEIPDIVTAGGGTVGVRWPRHPFIQAVIRACGFPLAAPSANPSGHLSPTTAEQVRKVLGAKIPLIIDGGQSQVGIESTVLDLCAQPPRVLRPGMIHLGSLRALLGDRGVQDGGGEAPAASREQPRSPGLLWKHYSPKARLVIRSWKDEAELNSQISALESPRERVHIIAHTLIPTGQGFGRVSVLPRDAEAFARSIYAELHRCDDVGAAVIVVEALPTGAEWQGIADRLRRAAGSHEA